MALPTPLPTFDLAQTLPGGFRFPTRMTVLPLADGTLALVSPIPIDDATADALAALGEVRFLVAPNLLHHLYLGDASRRYPGARVLAPAGLRAKRPDLRIDADLELGLPEAMARTLDAIPIEGAPGLSEFVFFDRPSGTLVVTDLVFHVVRPEGFVAHAALFVVGCHGRLEQSRALRAMFRDRVAAAASAERLLALPVQALIMAHGEPVTEDAHATLTAALAPMRRG